MVKRRKYIGQGIIKDGTPRKPFKQWIHENVDEILAIPVPITAEKIATHFKVSPTERGRIANLLKELERQGIVISISCKYRPNYNVKGPIPTIKESKKYQYERRPLRDYKGKEDKSQQKIL